MLSLFIFPNKFFAASFRRLNFDDDEAVEKSKNKKRTISLFYEENINDGSLKATDTKTESDNVQEKMPKKKRSFLSKLRTIFSSPIFVFSVLTMASLFFILTSIQFWGSNYMKNHLKIDNQTHQLISFAVICLTSPTIGVLVGGAIINKIGGYETKHSSIFCFICCCLSVSFIIPIPFFDNLIWFTIFGWLALFFGGALMAPLTGIIITSIPKYLAGSANSFTIFFSNLLGYLPAPVVYGLIEERFEEKNGDKRIAMKCCLWYSLVSIIFLGIATIFRYKNYKDIYRLNNALNINEDENENAENKKKEEDNKGSSIVADVPKIFNGMAATNDIKDEEGENIEEDKKEKDEEKNIGENDNKMSSTLIDDSNTGPLIPESQRESDYEIVTKE